MFSPGSAENPIVIRSHNFADVAIQLGVDDDGDHVVVLKDCTFTRCSLNGDLHRISKGCRILDHAPSRAPGAVMHLPGSAKNRLIFFHQTFVQTRIELLDGVHAEFVESYFIDMRIEGGRDCTFVRCVFTRDDIRAEEERGASPAGFFVDDGSGGYAFGECLIDPDPDIRTDLFESEVLTKWRDEHPTLLTRMKRRIPPRPSLPPRPSVSLPAAPSFFGYRLARPPAPPPDILVVLPPPPAQEPPPAAAGAGAAYPYAPSWTPRPATVATL
jgi:hypothetical protein